MPNNYRERRHCFVEQEHPAHVWEVAAGIQPYWCDGAETRPAPWTTPDPVALEVLGQQTSYPIGRCPVGAVHDPHTVLHGSVMVRCMGVALTDIDAEAREPYEPWNISQAKIYTDAEGETDIDQESAASNTPNAELAYRPEYGDPLQNMRDQAAMINAYLSGRPVTAIDVPVIFILCKAHRLGKMPDYKDNYDDIKGYLKILEGLIGDDMIEAATASEYRNIKANGQSERVMEFRFPEPVPFEPKPAVDEGKSYEDLIPREVMERLDLARKGPSVTPGRVPKPEGSGNPYANVQESED